MRGRGCAWQGGMRGRGCAWQGVCMVVGHAWQRGHAWQGGMHAMDTPPPNTTRYGQSMRGRYACYWNAFLLVIKIDNLQLGTSVAADYWGEPLREVLIADLPQMAIKGGDPRPLRKNEYSTHYGALTLNGTRPGQGQRTNVWRGVVWKRSHYIRARTGAKTYWDI